jgi:hypothetical protein
MPSQLTRSSARNARCRPKGDARGDIAAADHTEAVRLALRMRGGGGYRGEPFIRQSAGGRTWPAEVLSVTFRFLQRSLDVIPERRRHIGSGARDPAEPGHRRDRQQHVGDLVLTRACR